MHRFYQPLLPTSNLFLQHKWDFIDYETHRARVKNIRSEIDQTAPRTYPHIYIRPKQLQMQIENFCTIQRENKILLEKLAKIHRYGGWVDNDNLQHIPRSINTLARQKEAVRISNDNQTLLSRIKGEHTTYNRSKLEDSYVMQEKYRGNVDKFPREWREMGKDMTRFRADIRKRYIYPKYGRPKAKNTKHRKEENTTLSVLSSMKESEVTIHVPERTEEHKLQEILERIKNVCQKQGKDTQVKIAEENADEFDDSKSEDEINRDQKNDEENQDNESDEANKEASEVNQDKESGEVNQDKENEVNQDKENDDEKQNKGMSEVNQDKGKSEVSQDQETSKVNEYDERNQDNDEIAEGVKNTGIDE